MAKEKVLEIKESEFSKLINDKKNNFILVDFYADWCGPCQMMAPVLKKVAEKIGDKLTIAKINVDEAQKLAMKYEVSSIPCMILFKGGEEISRIIGFREEEDLVKEIKEYL